MIPSVRFSTVDDFIAELEADGDSIERNIVRVTSGPLRPAPGMGVIATAVEVDGVERRQMLRLVCPCGDIAQTREAERVLRSRLEGLGFDVRGGLVETEQAP